MGDDHAAEFVSNVPRRHVATWFDASTEERAAITAAIDQGRELLASRHHPDDFNIGINVGEAARQNVFHLHVHLIPRYSGDVPDPRGGVRHVIPGKGNYLVKAHGAGRTEVAPRLVSGGEEDPLYRFLLGLTATPERTDGGDLLALCEENLAYCCDLVEGVKQELLCRFRYFGVPDEVDYRNTPWRNSRFDEEELTRHVATQSRARNALEQLEKRGGTRARQDP